jgi:hypothetical protein
MRLYERGRCQRHFVRLARCLHALTEHGHASGISPMNPPSQFERPRLGRRRGTIAALRRADHMPVARQGFRLLRFTAPGSSGGRGGPLVGSQGVHLGIITNGISRGPGGAPAEAGFAVPIETVIGLANGNSSQAPGSGAALKMTAVQIDR